MSNGALSASKWYELKFIPFRPPPQRGYFPNRDIDRCGASSAKCIVYIYNKTGGSGPS